MENAGMNGLRGRRLVPTVVGLLLALAATPVTLAGPPSQVYACLGCHSLDGVSYNPNVPTIAGASVFYLENQLLLFQGDDRPCVGEIYATISGAPAADHCALVADLSEDDIEVIAGHFSGQTFRPAAQAVDEDKAEAGAGIYQRSCARCHTEGGSNPDDDAGILAGQWEPYLVRALTDLRDERRLQPKSMAWETRKLSDDDIQALAAFFAGQGQ
jgi:cytochrome subunit of sulfide dehydrogenase